MLEQIQVIIDKGGIMMIPLGICSFLTVFITLEKIFFLRKGRLLAPSYLKQWNDFFSENQSKSKVNKNAPAILHQVFLPLVDALPMPHERLEERIADLSRKQKHQLERGMVFLETIAGIAPLFGLLGTALGMVEVFSRLSAMGEAKISALSSGISQALFTTVAGLFIGIPALIAYNLLNRHIQNLLIEAENQINLLVDGFHDQMVQK